MSIKISEHIESNNPQLASFLREELNNYPDVPDYFEDVNYIPTEEELTKFSDYQLVYLKQSVNEDESDAIYEGQSYYDKMHDRKVKVHNMIKKEIIRRYGNNKIWNLNIIIAY